MLRPPKNIRDIMGKAENSEFSPRLKLIKIPAWLIFSYFIYRELGFIYHYGIMDELITLRFIKKTFFLTISLCFYRYPYREGN